MRHVWVIFIVIAFCAGGAVFEFCKLKSQISYTLDFGSIFDAFVLLLVGALIEYVYLRQSSDKRADTDLLLVVVGDAKAAFCKVEQQEQSCEGNKILTAEERLSLTCAERDLSNAVRSIEVALGHCKVDLQKLRFDKLKDARSELKDSLTDTPFPGPYDPASLVRIRGALRTMRDELTRMAFAINHR